MRSTTVPRPVRHRSGQAIVFLPDPATGKRRGVYMGPFGSPEAAKRYREVLAQHLAGASPTTSEAKAPPTFDPTKGSWPTCSRLVADFLLDAEQHYRNERGEVSREVVNLRLALRPFLEELRDRTTDTLSCADLGAVRQRWTLAECCPERDDQGKPIPGTGRKYARGAVNNSMRRCLFVLRWGAERNMVPGPVWHSLTAFRHLGYGRGGLRETDPVEAVPRGVVDAILPHLPPILQTAVELLWWSGMRAGELCGLAMRDIERGEQVWIYRPRRHKGAWRGRERVVRFGPRCQELLRPLLKADPEAHLFSPLEVMRQRKEAWRAARASKPTPSQLRRDERNRRKPSPYGDQFDVWALRRAIHRACDAAGVERFGLHRLRHAAGTRLVLEAGDDAARLLLGHADERMVRRYSRAAEAVAGAAVAVRHA